MYIIVIFPIFSFLFSFISTQSNTTSSTSLIVSSTVNKAERNLSSEIVNTTKTAVSSTSVSPSTNIECTMKSCLTTSLFFSTIITLQLEQKTATSFSGSVSIINTNKTLSSTSIINATPNSNSSSTSITNATPTSSSGSTSIANATFTSKSDFTSIATATPTSSSGSTSIANATPTSIPGSTRITSSGVTTGIVTKPSVERTSILTPSPATSTPQKTSIVQTNNFCQPSYCMNGGECKNATKASVNSPVCVCKSNYYGPKCEKFIGDFDKEISKYKQFTYAFAGTTVFLFLVVALMLCCRYQHTETRGGLLNRFRSLTLEESALPNLLQYTTNLDYHKELDDFEVGNKRASIVLTNPNTPMKKLDMYSSHDPIYENEDEDKKITK